MYRSTSCGSYDIQGVGEDVRAQGGREALGRNELDVASQDGLEQISKVDEVRQRLLLGLKLDEQVDITVRMRGIAADRSEQRQAPNAQPENFGLDGLQASLHIGAGGSLSDHETNLSRRVARATSS